MCRHRSRGHRGPPPGRGSRAAPQHRRPRHGQGGRASTAATVGVRSPSPRPAARCATRSSAGSPTRSPPSTGSTAVGLDFTVDDRRGARGAAPAAPRRTRPPPPAASPPTATPRAGSIPFADPSRRTRVLLIASGKGGVGKSSVTTNLAVALAAAGQGGRRHRRRRVGLLDPADARRRPAAGGDRLACSCRPRPTACGASPWASSPRRTSPSSGGVRCCTRRSSSSSPTSTGTTPTTSSSTCRPAPATSRISLAQFLPRAEVYVVTTPQPAAQRVAQRAAAMAEKVNLEVKGVIENMAWFTGDDGKRYEIFGAGGGQELADKLEVPLLGQVPLVSAAARGLRHRRSRSSPATRQRGRPGVRRHRRAHRRRAGPHPPVPRRAQAHLTRRAPSPSVPRSGRGTLRSQWVGRTIRSG